MGLLSGLFKKEKKELIQPSSPPPGAYPKVTDEDLTKIMKDRISQNEKEIIFQKIEADRLEESIILARDLSFKEKEEQMKMVEELRRRIIECEGSLEEQKKHLKEWESG